MREEIEKQNRKEKRRKRIMLLKVIYNGELKKNSKTAKILEKAQEPQSPTLLKVVYFKTKAYNDYPRQRKKKETHQQTQSLTIWARMIA